jgi:hypothetical protein
MLNPEARKLARSWIARAEKCKPKTLHGAFDRFLNLFVAYNALYQQAADALLASGAANEDDVIDSRAATVIVVRILGPDKLDKHLRQECGKDLQQLSIDLLNGKFCITVNRRTGEPDLEQDRILAQELQSSDSARYCSSVLTAIYRVRCNMFHGRKLPTHIQIEPLRVLSAALHTTAELLLSHMHAEA